jgi:hypothetical protein
MNLESEFLLILVTRGVCVFIRLIIIVGYVS